MLNVPRVAVWVFPENEIDTKVGERIGIARTSAELAALLKEAEDATCVAVRVRRGFWLRNFFFLIQFSQKAAD